MLAVGEGIGGVTAGSTLLLAHERGASLLGLSGTLLPGSSTSEGSSLSLGGQALLLLAIAAAEEGEGGDAEDDGDAKDNGDDDAANIERGLLLHADITTADVLGAEEVSLALGGGDLLVTAVCRLGVAVVRHGLADLGVFGKCREAILSGDVGDLFRPGMEAVVQKICPGEDGGGGGTRSGGVLVDATATASELCLGGEDFRAALLGVASVGGGVAGGATSCVVALGEETRVGRCELGEAEGEDGQVTTASIGGHVTTVVEDTVGYGFVVLTHGGSEGAGGEENSWEYAHDDDDEL